MPYTQKQKNLFYAELGRRKKGQSGRLDVSTNKLESMVKEPLRAELKRKKKKKSMTYGKM